MNGKFFKVFEQVIQKSRAFFFFPFPPTFPSPSCYNWNLPESGGHYRPYSLLKPWLFTSPTPYIHRILIQVRTLPSSLLSFADHFPLFSSGKEKKIPSSFEAYRISGCVACCPSLLQSSAHLQSPIRTCFLGGVGPCLTAPFSRITPASFWAASTSAEDTGLTSNGLVLYLTSATSSQGQTLGLVMTNNNCIISEIIFLSFLLSDHRLLSFQLNSLGPNTQVVPPFQGDLQPIDSTVPEYPSSFSSLLTHLRFHGPSL